MPFDSDAHIDEALVVPSMSRDELRANVEARLAEVNVVLQVDAGTMELVELTDDGVVKLRFGGMCVACPSRPNTTAFTIRPMFMDVPGVTRVEVEGARLSTEAQDRMVAMLRRAAETA